MRCFYIRKPNVPSIKLISCSCTLSIHKKFQAKVIVVFFLNNAYIDALAHNPLNVKIYVQDVKFARIHNWEDQSCEREIMESEIHV